MLQPYQVAIAVAAVAVIVGTLIYRARTRRKTAEFFAGELANPDPQVRAAACIEWTEYGLARSCQQLLQLIEQEKDPYVLATLADAVRSRAWEPQSSARVAELREFAAGYHRDNSPVTKGEQP